MPASADESDDTVTDHGVPRWVRRLVVVAASSIALAVAVVWLLGGFEPRRDYLVFSPGQEVAGGNLLFTLDSATARRTTTGDWEVVVLGSVRNPHHESLPVITGDSGNLAVNTGTTSAVLERVELGGNAQRAVVSPDNQPIQLAAYFRLPGETTLATSLRVGVFVMEYSNNNILDLAGGERWHEADRRVYAAVLPLLLLEPKK